jgi:hypothetical protein
MSYYDTGTEIGRNQRLSQIVRDYTKNRAWRAIARLIGGSPRYDLQDYSDFDAGEPPKGAEWN